MYDDDEDCMNKCKHDHVSDADERLLKEYIYVRKTQGAKVPDVKNAWKCFDKHREDGGRALRLWGRCAAAASVALLIGVGCVFFGTGSQSVRLSSVADGGTLPDCKRTDKLVNGLHEVNDRARKINGFLALAGDDDSHSGDSHQQDSSALSANARVKIAAMKVLNIAITTVVAPKGAVRELTLSDGTVVVLNAGSKISYPVSFYGSERKVKLTGEAFFNVAKDIAHPFVVTAGDMVATVLGTQFDINSWKEDNVMLTLVSGLVKVSDRRDNGRMAMVWPGQRATLGVGDNITTAEADTTLALKWKNGLFAFANTKITDAIDEINRWYGVSIQIDSALPASHTLTLELPRSTGLKALVDVICKENGMQVVYKGDEIMLMRVED